MPPRNDDYPGHPIIRGPMTEEALHQKPLKQVQDAARQYGAREVSA